MLSFVPLLSKYGQTSTVVSLLQRLDRDSKLSPEGLRELGLLHEGTGQLVKRRDLRAREQSSKPSMTLLLDLARVSHKQKDPQTALGYLAHARDLNPQYPHIYYLFGECVRSWNFLGRS